MLCNRLSCTNIMNWGELQTRWTCKTARSLHLVYTEMWPLTRKRTLLLSFQTPWNRSPAICHLFVNGLWSMGCRSNGLDHLFRKISSRLNGCCYPFENNLHPFERPRSSIWTAEVICSNQWGYLFGRNRHLFERLRLSIERNRHLFEWLRLSIQTAEVIHSKKIFIRSNS